VGRNDPGYNKKKKLAEAREREGVPRGKTNPLLKIVLHRIILTRKLLSEKKKVMSAGKRRGTIRIGRITMRSAPFLFRRKRNSSNPSSTGKKREKISAKGMVSIKHDQVFVNLDETIVSFIRSSQAIGKRGNFPRVRPGRKEKVI